MLGDWDEEVDPRGWWVASVGSTGEGGERLRRRGRRGRGERGGTVRVPGELLIRTHEEAGAHFWEPLKEGNDGHGGDDGYDERDQGDDKGAGGDKGADEGGDEGVEKEADTGAENGGAGSKDAPRQPPPPHAEGVVCVSQSAKGGVVGSGANRADRANRAKPPPSDLAPARKVTFQRTDGVGWGANRANRGVGWGNLALCESGGTLRPCD